MAKGDYLIRSLVAKVCVAQVVNLQIVRRSTPFAAVAVALFGFCGFGFPGWRHNVLLIIHFEESPNAG
jgi:hypothetical protein